MTLSYRTSGSWGPGLGRPLHSYEADGNVYEFDTRLASIEGRPSTVVSIQAIQVANNNMYVHLTDGTVEGPFPLPLQTFINGGQWMPNTTYQINTFITYNAALYLVIWAHTSQSTFDPGANDGQGHNYYSLMFQMQSAVPQGGFTGQALTKRSNFDLDTYWSTILGVPLGGNPGAVLMKHTAADGDMSWQPTTSLQIPLAGLSDTGIVSPTAGDTLRFDGVSWRNWTPRVITTTLAQYIPALNADEGGMIVFGGTGAQSLLIHNDVTTNFPVGTELSMMQSAVGPVTVVTEGGVTLRFNAGFQAQLQGQYATATVKKIGANLWLLFGLLLPA